MKIYQWKSSLIEYELSSSAKLMGFVLSEFYRENKDCYPGITLLTEASSLGSRNTVLKAIKELQTFGVIKITKKRKLGNSRESNVYEFVGVDNEPSSEPSSELSTVPSTVPSISILEVTESTEVTKSIKERKKYAEEMKNIWNETCVSLPPIRILNDDRKRKMDELIGSMKIKDPDGKPLFEDISDWKYICEEIQKTPFLCGDNDRKWRADIDFCLQKSNLVKIYEGKYDSKK